MDTPITTKFFWLVSLCLLPSLAAAAGTQSVSAVPGKTVCSHGSASIEGASGKLELCLTQSTGFSRADNYVLSINGKEVIQSSADETVKGASGKVGSTSISLTCTPRLKAPEKVSDIMIRTYQRTMKVSKEEARKMAIREGSVEVGRLCSINANNALVQEVLFNFR